MASIDINNISTHYDIGIYGWWGHDNFGGCLTYYALNTVLTKLGYSILMIQEAKGLPGRYIIPDDCIAMQFAKQHYNYTIQANAAELVKLNYLCDTFIVGGDQMWSFYIPFVKEDNFLNFVDESKSKISYSTSFGPANFNPNEHFKNKVKPLLQRFDSISVREDYAVDIAKNVYGINATQVIDAVFLLNKEDYIEASSNYTYHFPKKYLFAFILDPTPEKRIQIEAIAKKLELTIVCAPDAASGKHKIFKEIFAGLNIISPLNINNFLKAYEKATYIVTDSFHGTCFSYIYKKPFSVYYNSLRGADRFISLMKLLNLEKRRIFETQSIDELLNNDEISLNIDWNTSDINVKKEKDLSLKWLISALNARKKKQERIQSKVNYFEDINIIDNLYKNRDFINIRLLASLFRDYGIKHIVLSPGGRDLPIVRMFEYNEQYFILHRVTDERSAAYYGMGIATQLRQPVACICTSGTAASNFLPAVTEAFYTGIPLILVTADRYEVFLNHGEDQTIPQKHIYSDVVKMEVSLPEATGPKGDYQTRRDIASCILETTHNGFGPVHINIPIDNVQIGATIPRMYWSLLPFITPHIQRVGINNGQKDIIRWVNSLKKSPRILVVYGQHEPINEKQRNNIEKFASKFNCTIVTDHISNLKCKYSLMPHLMLQAINQDEFNNNLTPDILITVGGKRLMNDPLTFKIRGGAHGIRHWSVTPDGKIRDFYFRLTSVIEMEQDYFFELFAELAGDIHNDELYYNKWLSMTNKYISPTIQKFDSLYIQSKFLPSIPSNSILHLGVGQSFIECRKFHIDSSVEVYCNMGTNGIDGSTSTFLGQCAVVFDKLCFLLVGDLSFFYDMNSLWNKPLTKNIRILMVNNNGTGLLRTNLQAISSVHNTSAEGWVKSTGFEYISAKNKDEYNEKLKYFLSNAPEKALFFEVFCE